MYCNTLAQRLALVGAALLLAACADQTKAPTGLTETDASSMALHGAAMHPTTDVVQQATEPFTFRAPLDPYRIHDQPDFMVHSRARTDLVVQRIVFTPGRGPWHTHPGPSFIIVEQGQIKLTRFAARTGCVDTPVFGPGDAYFEVANEVHRATVLGTESAVLHVVRFNIPVGGAITIPAEDPGC